jgi:hypothetical protein
LEEEAGAEPYGSAGKRLVATTVPPRTDTQEESEVVLPFVGADTNVSQ